MKRVAPHPDRGKHGFPIVFDWLNDATEPLGTSIGQVDLIAQQAICPP
jgi:hypothetical protein